MTALRAMVCTIREDVDPQILEHRRLRYSRIGRMREHLRRQRINAMRHDGTFEDMLMVQLCKAYFLLPEELGLQRPDRSNTMTDQL